MCAVADALKGYDTPQALPVLGVLHSRAPGRLGMLLRFPIISLLLALVFLLLLGLVGVVGGLVYLGYERVLSPISQTQGWWLYLWGGIALLAIVWLVILNQKTRKILAVEERATDVRLPGFWRGLLWSGRLVTRIAMVAMWLVGIAGLLLPAFYGLHEAWDLLRDLDPIVLGPFPPLNEYLGLSPFISVGPALILIIAGILIVVLAIWARVILVGAFWLFGLAMIYISGSFALEEMGVLAALAVLWPFQIPYWVARLFRWPYRRWRDQIERLVLGWELRDSLSAAFTEHRRRNRARVGGDGASAVCKNDLAFFVQHHAGPLTFWWCPECQDDDAAYTGVKTVRGVLDTAMTARYEQQNSVLRVNLRAWQESHGPLASPPLQEVYIGQLADPHEVELFITQYHGVQADRKWPPLGKVTAVIAADSKLDENGRRQVQRNMRMG